VGNQVTTTGRGTRTFAYRGPLPGTAPEDAQSAAKWWNEIAANAGVGWDSINAYGLEAGRGQLSGSLANGLIRFEPLDVSFTQGRLRATPEIFLARDPAVLVLGQGRVIEQARITPELLESWLQYVAPLLANATRAEGLFSIDLEKASVPVSNAHQSDVAGALTIHAAQVRPGPMTQQLVNVAQQVDTILRRRPPASGSSAELQIDEQIVPFQIVEGRVHHRDLFIEVGDVMVRSRGSVGFDKTLRLVAEVPILDKWVERDANLRALRGQTLEIPIEGTLSNPKIDNRILKDLARKVAGGTVNNLIDGAVKDGLDKGLEGLFKQFQR
jgi:hypothetical protein